MLMLVRNTGKDRFIYIKNSAPMIGFFPVRLRNDIMKDFFTTSGQQMEPYVLKNINNQNLWTSPIYQLYKPLQILIHQLHLHFKSCFLHCLETSAFIINQTCILHLFRETDQVIHFYIYNYQYFYYTLIHVRLWLLLLFGNRKVIAQVFNIICRSPTVFVFSFYYRMTFCKNS